ncbi:MAG: lipocalin family protein [Cyclobacteriaceae bacterium]|nr:lipocalin family protein [Cyclobacteriaceae bacterium]
MKLSGSFLLLTIVIFLYVAACEYNPERSIVGDWKAISHEYVKADAGAALSHLESHNAELPVADTWRFKENNTLYFIYNHKIIDSAEWKLKGRGHLVSIVYHGREPEKYQIRQLSKEDLVIYYNLKKDVRAIAKIEFQRQH